MDKNREERREREDGGGTRKWRGVGMHMGKDGTVFGDWA